MSNWNYRVIQRQHFKHTYFTVNEVFYDAHDGVIAWAEAAATPYGDTLEELMADTALIARAFEKDVLLEEDLPYG